jgi:hypothetical protein
MGSSEPARGKRRLLKGGLGGRANVRIKPSCGKKWVRMADQSVSRWGHPPDFSGLCKVASLEASHGDTAAQLGNSEGVV